MVLVDFFDLGCVDDSGLPPTLRLRTLDSVRHALSKLREAGVKIGVVALSTPDTYSVGAVWQATQADGLGELIDEHLVRSAILPSDAAAALTVLRGLRESLDALDGEPLLVSARQRIRTLAGASGFRTARHALLAEAANRSATMQHGWMNVPVAWSGTPPVAPALLPLGPVVLTNGSRKALALVERDQVAGLREEGLVWEPVESSTNPDVDFELSYLRTDFSSGWQAALRTDPPGALPLGLLPGALDAPSVPPRCGGPIIRFHAQPALLEDKRLRPVVNSFPDVTFSTAELSHIDSFIQESDIRDIVDKLTQLGTRYVCNSLNPQAATLLKLSMEARVQPQASVSLPVFHIPQSVGGERRHNIVAELSADPQSSSAHEIVAISAHYDAITGSARCLDPATHAAPGADDNASGVAIVLAVADALARAFKQRRPRRAVRLILFNCEEVELAGSDAYLSNCVDTTSNRQIVAALNVDMAGIYASGKQDKVEVNPGGGSQASQKAQELAWFVGRVVDCLATGRLLKHVREPAGDPTGFVNTNDGMSFHMHQIPACTVSEWFGDDAATVGPHPTWHSTKDVARAVDTAYVRDLAMIVCASALRLADPR